MHVCHECNAFRNTQRSFELTIKHVGDAMDSEIMTEFIKRRRSEARKWKKHLLTSEDCAADFIDRKLNIDR